ncbi:SIMPL domain-containing protein [Candidatus Peregrinibacteria bacterium]|nr:SIMPL domain-containing protein [Candidatus Peregrinibacteria bacterium]
MEDSLFKKILMASGSLFLFVVSLFILFNGLGNPWFKNIKAEITNQPSARIISVDAEGKVTVKPDIALIDLSVVAQGKTVKAVTQEGNVKMTAVIDTVKKLGIDSKDIASTRYSLYPNYTYPQNQSPQLSDYTLIQDIRVKVRVLDTVEGVLDAGIAAGANQVGQLSFDIDDPSAVKKQAWEMAFKIAKEKALEMASAADVRLGRVVTFSEGSGYQPPVYANYRLDLMAEKADSVGASIEPGSQDIMVNVSVTYEIE